MATGMDKPKISSSSKIFRHQNIMDAQPKKPRTMRNAGKLMRVMNVPVEVFLEVLSYLSPLDLLNMSRVSKELRNTVLSRKIRSIWVKALKSIDPPLPDTPDDMIEPQYLSLILERDCMACGAGRALWKVSYAARIRMCGPCWKVNVKSGYKLAKEHIIHEDDAALLDIIVNLLPEATTVGITQPIETVVQGLYMDFYEPEFVATLKQYKKVRDEDSGSLQQFLEARKASTLARRNFDAMIRKRECTVRSTKVLTQRDAGYARKAAIQEKLESLGYKLNDYPLADIEFEKLMYQPRELTPRIWNTIRPKLAAILERTRARREEFAFEKKWRVRIQQLEAHYASYLQDKRSQSTWKCLLPNLNDAMKLPCMVKLITCEEPDEFIVHKQFLRIENALVEDAQDYRTRVFQHLVKLVQASLDTTPPAESKKGPQKKGNQQAAAADPSPEVDLALLDLPTSTFSCQSHGCRTMALSSTSVLKHWQSTHHEAFDPKRIRLTPESTRKFVPILLEALGLFEDTTLSGLDEFVESQRGKPVCTCGQRFLETLESWKTASFRERLLLHILPRSGQSVLNAVHRITFAPVTETEPSPMPGSK